MGDQEVNRFRESNGKGVDKESMTLTPLIRSLLPDTGHGDDLTALVGRINCP